MPTRKGGWTAENNPRWNNGRCISQGYVLIRRPGHPHADNRGYVREHVLVAERTLGRPLATNEVAHHINGIRDDNRPENIQVMTRGAHHSHHHQGVVKPVSVANLTRMTPELARRIWQTTRQRTQRICEECGIAFYGTRKRQHAHVYCSKRCGGIAAARTRARHR